MSNRLHDPQKKQEALQGRVTAEHGKSRKQEGWRTVFGAAPKGSVSEVQHLIDEEFSKIK